MMTEEVVAQDLTSDENIRRVRSLVHSDSQSSLFCGNTEAVT